MPEALEHSLKKKSTTLKCDVNVGLDDPTLQS